MPTRKALAAAWLAVARASREHWAKLGEHRAGGFDTSSAGMIRIGDPADPHAVKPAVAEWLRSGLVTREEIADLV